MRPIVLLFKSLIPAHTRRLKTGKVVNVRQYTDKRTKRLEDDKTLDMFADEVTTPRQELIDEHKRLVDVLESPSRKDDKVEAKKQKEELEGYEGKPTDDTPQIDAMIARAKALGFDGIGIKASLELYRNGRNPGQGVTSREEGIASLERMLAAAEAKPAGTASGARMDLHRDGIDGEEIDYQSVPNGNSSFQYARGRTTEGGQVAIFRRRADERGTYGGWRWERDEAKPAPKVTAVTRGEDDPETALRATWTEQGVPKARQDELIAQIAGKAAPGAKVGPLTVGQPALKPAEVNGAKLKELIGSSLGLHEFDVEGGGKVKAEVKVTKRNGEVKTKYLHITAIQPSGAWVYYREQANGNFKEVASGRGTPPKVVSVKASKPKADAMAIGQRVTLARVRHDKYVGMSGHVAAHIKSRGIVKIALDNGEYYEALPANIDAIDDGVTGAGYAKVQADKAKREAAAKRREEWQEQARIEAEKQKNAAAKMADRVTSVMPGVPESDHKKIMNAVQRARRGNAGAHVVVSHYGHPFNYVDALPFNTLDAAQKYVGIKKDEDFRSKGTHGVFSPRAVSVKAA